MNMTFSCNREDSDRSYQCFDNLMMSNVLVSHQTPSLIQSMMVPSHNPIMKTNSMMFDPMRLRPFIADSNMQRNPYVPDCHTELLGPFGNGFPPSDAFEPTPIGENTRPPVCTVIDTSRVESALDATFNGMGQPHFFLDATEEAPDLLNFFDDHQADALQQVHAAEDHQSIFTDAIDAALVTMRVKDNDAASMPNIRKASSCPDIKTDAPAPKRRRISNGGKPSFRKYQESQWMEQFQELLEFKKQHGHCLIPHNYPENQVLSRWVKRQRYQYKLKMTGKVSTMTEARIKKLEDVGFVWNSHTTIWDTRLKELKQYIEEHGDCDVPMNYPANPALATWIKCQRRQYKLFWSQDKASSMTLDRIKILDDLGFIWNVHKKDLSVSPILEQEVMVVA